MYWLWRDRKGLLGHPVSLLANVVFAYGVLRWGWANQTRSTWHLGVLIAGQPVLLSLLVVNTVMILWRQAVRGVFVDRVYGWKYALTVPLRAPWANGIDCCATLIALWTFVMARLRHKKLHWAKTAHSYPSRVHRVSLKPRLGEILVAEGRLTQSPLNQALAQRQSNERIGETLVRQGLVSEPDVYRALSWQQEVPFRDLRPAAIQRDVFSSLTPSVARELCVMPYLRDGLNQVWVASPQPPSEETERILTDLLSNRPRFVLITPTNYDKLTASLARQPENDSIGDTQVAGAWG